MARGFVDRILVFMGIHDDPVEPVDLSQPAPERVKPQAPAEEGEAGHAGSRNGIKLGPDGMPTTQVMVLRPRLFEDVQLIAATLKGQRPVVVRLDGCSKDVAQRIIDFTSGVTYVLDGHMRRLGDDIFLFTPQYMAIDEEEPEADQGPGAAPPADGEGDGDPQPGGRTGTAGG